MQIDARLRFQLKGKHSLFRNLEPSDISREYLKSLRQAGTYLSNTGPEITRHQQSEYLRAILRSENDTIFGLFVEKRLIGTVGCQNISRSSEATLGLLIFPETIRNKGYGSTAIWCACRLLSADRGVYSFRAGVSADNLASKRLFHRSGFRETKHIENENKVVYRALISDVTQPSQVESPKIDRFHD